MCVIMQMVYLFGLSQQLFSFFFVCAERKKTLLPRAKYKRRLALEWQQKAKWSLNAAKKTLDSALQMKQKTRIYLTWLLYYSIYRNLIEINGETANFVYLFSI